MEEGGLDLRSLANVNKVLMAKLYEILGLLLVPYGILTWVINTVRDYTLFLPIVSLDPIFGK